MGEAVRSSSVSPVAKRLGFRLGIAYSASIGGVATLVDTPPNLALVRIFELSFPANAGDQLSFGQWMLFAVPLSIVMLSIARLVLTRLVFRIPAHLTLPPAVLENERSKLGTMNFEEKAVALVFASTALLWVFRKDLTIGSFTLPGWSGLLPFGNLTDDGSVKWSGRESSSTWSAWWW